MEFTNSIKNKKIIYLEKSLLKEKSLKELVINVRKVFPYNFRTHQLKNKNVKMKIIKLIEKYRKACTLSECLNSIGLSKNVYRRWMYSIPCNFSQNDCVKRHPLQLTLKEVITMKKLVHSLRYAHFSTYSLSLFAQRKGSLYCSPETWYKYLKIYSWIRPVIKKKKIRNKDGIPSKRPNQIWHIDVTQIKTQKGKKILLTGYYR